ncbi:MAG: hypothetical protein AVDCRST_MAG65-1820, partial [uncultured Solirubrobacteraceae bacterium]
PELEEIRAMLSAHGLLEAASAA